MKSILAAALTMSLAAPALAATPPDAKKNAGTWTLSGAQEGGSACTLKFTAEGAIGGWSINVPKTCVKRFPRLEDAAAWTLYPDGAIGIIDPLRQRIYRFEKTKDGDFVTAPNKDGERFVLTKGPPAKALTAEQRMSGGWSVTGLGGKPRCAFVSKSNAAGTQGTLKAKAGPDCPAKWKSVGWAGWSQKAGKLNLLDAKGKITHTLKKGDPVTYEGETKGGDPLYFSRD